MTTPAINTVHQLTWLLNSSDRHCKSADMATQLQQQTVHLLTLLLNSSNTHSTSADMAIQLQQHTQYISWHGYSTPATDSTSADMATQLQQQTVHLLTWLLNSSDRHSTSADLATQLQRQTQYICWLGTELAGCSTRQRFVCSSSIPQKSLAAVQQLAERVPRHSSTWKRLSWNFRKCLARNVTSLVCVHRHAQYNAQPLSEVTMLQL
jgi:hypothetical protein